MPAIRLIAWNEEDAARRAGELAAAGVKVDASPLRTSGLVAQLKGIDAVCIDLDRLPSHGREVATALRNTKTLRHIAIVFAGGPRDKVSSIKKALPDAVYTEWSYAAGALRKALKSVPKTPVTPPAHMERFAGRPLAGKLGITPDIGVAFYGAPTGFEEQFADVRRSPDARLIVWFVRSRAELEREMEFMAARLPSGGGIWIAYPKLSGKIRADFKESDVRAAGLTAGLVDYKICAIDSDWTGLKFARKKR